MRRKNSKLEDVKNKIKELKGVNIFMEINRGRKKIDRFNAIIESVYPSVFTVKVDALHQQETQTFSYFDVLCGDVEITQITAT
jgi:uncharacterized protein Veg